jgi:hypothetical protein
MTTDELVRINKEYFVKASESAVKIAFFGAFPYLNVPPFNLIIDQGLNWIVRKIADGLELSAFFTFVDLRVSEQGREYVAATIQANKTQSVEDIRIADEKFKSLVKFNYL